MPTVARKSTYSRTSSVSPLTSFAKLRWELQWMHSTTTNIRMSCGSLGFLCPPQIIPYQFRSATQRNRFCMANIPVAEAETILVPYGIRVRVRSASENSDRFYEISDKREMGRISAFSC